MIPHIYLSDIHKYRSKDEVGLAVLKRRKKYYLYYSCLFVCF